MPIDENQLATDIKTATEENRKAEIKESEIRQILANLNSLVMIEEKVPNNTGGFDLIKNMPEDRAMGGKKMTVTRRQEIYTVNKTKLDALIASG